MLLVAFIGTLLLVIIIGREREGYRKDSFSGFRWELRDELNLQAEIISLTMSHIISDNVIKIIIALSLNLR